MSTYAHACYRGWMFQISCHLLDNNAITNIYELLTIIIIIISTLHTKLNNNIETEWQFNNNLKS